LPVLSKTLVLALLAGMPVDDDLPPEQVGPITGPQPPPWKPFNLYSLISRDELIAEIELRHLEATSFPDLLERVTRGLVAAPYLLSPLGEGVMPDPDPRFRMDAFDCTTFVETAIALASCDDLSGVEGLLDQIRYRGDPTFEHRRHLMTVQWVPELIEGGFVVDVTAKVGGAKTKWITMEMNDWRWRTRRVARTLDLDEVPKGKFKLPYIEIEELRKRLKDVPPGSIINVVRKDVPRSPEVITHQGLIIHKKDSGDVPFVRHASPVAKRVIDETLDYKLQRYLKPRKWPIIGINILAIVDPRKVDARLAEVR
jgi:hypothetical protein